MTGLFATELDVMVGGISSRTAKLNSNGAASAFPFSSLTAVVTVTVTADEFGNPQNKRIALRLNGVTKQDAQTSDMIFSVRTIIEWLSKGLTLEPGDIIATGTPEGVGMGRTPPEWLHDGDVVETEVDGIGVMRNRVVDC